MPADPHDLARRVHRLELLVDELVEQAKLVDGAADFEQFRLKVESEFGRVKEIMYERFGEVVESER